MHILLRRDGWAINHKRTRRLYSELDMQFGNKTPKRRVKAALRADRTPPSRSNEVWAMDFVHDQLANGGKFRILTAIDIYSRYARVVDPRSGYRGSDVVATLDRVCKETGYPREIRVDQGSEFVSRDLDLWAYQNSVTLDFSRPGKPTIGPVRVQAFCTQSAVERLDEGIVRGSMEVRTLPSLGGFEGAHVRSNNRLMALPPLHWGTPFCGEVTGLFRRAQERQRRTARRTRG